MFAFENKQMRQANSHQSYFYDCEDIYKPSTQNKRASADKGKTANRANTLQRIKCKLCSSNIVPFWPNPNEVMWMCENDDCVFPFGDAPLHVDEVCLFKPQNSSCSLIKQVQLIQEGSLSSTCVNEGQQAVEVQPDLKESMRKVESLLTNYQQNCGQDCICNSNNCQGYLDNVEQVDHFMIPERNFGDHPEFNFSIESDTIFKVEKVCGYPFWNDLSFSDLDYENGQVSACSKFDDSSSNLDDVEMEDEDNSFTVSQGKTKSIETKPEVSKWIESVLTSKTAHYYE